MTIDFICVPTEFIRGTEEEENHLLTGLTELFSIS